MEILLKMLTPLAWIVTIFCYAIMLLKIVLEISYALSIRYTLDKIRGLSVTYLGNIVWYWIFGTIALVYLLST